MFQLFTTLISFLVSGAGYSNKRFYVGAQNGLVSC